MSPAAIVIVSVKKVKRGAEMASVCGPGVRRVTGSSTERSSIMTVEPRGRPTRWTAPESPVPASADSLPRERAESPAGRGGAGGVGVGADGGAEPELRAGGSGLGGAAVARPESTGRAPLAESGDAVKPAEPVSALALSAPAPTPVAKPRDL